jgi:surface polysaccharide O-acyltransferase-like enzyme
MWFCAALLAFSLVYALLRGTRPAVPRDGADHTDSRTILAFIVVMALATFGVRTFVPETVSVLNMHPGDFPQYVLMFAAGIVVHRGGWFERLPQRIASRWAIATLALSLPLLALLVVTGGALDHDTERYSGGFNFVSAGKCLWEAMVCVGMSFGLIALYRQCFNRQGRSAKFLSDNAFAVYLFHPPVIIALAIMLHSVAAPPLVKTVLLTACATVVTFTLSALVFRRLPVLNRIL